MASNKIGFFITLIVSIISMFSCIFFDFFSWTYKPTNEFYSFGCLNASSNELLSAAAGIFVLTILFLIPITYSIDGIKGEEKSNKKTAHRLSGIIFIICILFFITIEFMFNNNIYYQWNFEPAFYFALGGSGINLLFFFFLRD